MRWIMGFKENTTLNRSYIEVDANRIILQHLSISA